MASTSTSSGAGGSATSNDCFAYATFDAGAPVSFKTDVAPIFQGSCALSTACHTCDRSANPTCTNSTYTPFLGVPAGDAGAPTAAVLAAVIASTVGKPAVTQVSLADGMTMVGNPSMDIIKAGDPANSFMMYKLDGAFPTTPTTNDVTCSTLTCDITQTCGEAMPAGGSQLAARDTIRRWIAQGAQNN
jgi:hypothetical protein